MIIGRFKPDLLERLGTYFKKDGKFENFVEYDRVARFMEKVNTVRR